MAAWEPSGAAWEQSESRAHWISAAWWGPWHTREAPEKWGKGPGPGSRPGTFPAVGMPSEAQQNP